jgi:hypothetical protein
MSHPEFNKGMQAKTPCGSMWVLNQNYHGGFRCFMIT